MISYDYIIYDMYVIYICIIYIYKWILSTPDPPSLRILMQEWYSREESGEEGWTYLDNCGYSNQKGSGVLSVHFDISWYILPSTNLGKTTRLQKRKASCGLKEKIMSPGSWTSHHGMDQKISKSQSYGNISRSSGLNLMIQVDLKGWPFPSCLEGQSLS